MKIYPMVMMFAAMLMLANMLPAQQDHIQPTRIEKANHFRKTAPLRDMTVILPGERDRSWKDGIIRNEMNLMTGDGTVKNSLPDGPDPLLQDRQGSRMHRGPELNFDGVGNVSGVIPPDTDGDVGPDHYFQMINLAFAIYDKQGNKLYGPVDNSTLWNDFMGPWTGTNDGDPILLYDEMADRWMASQFAVNTSDGTFWQLMAVSESGDPLGAYYQYAFQFPAFNDYPKYGIWPDAYYATFNMFGDYNRTAAAAFERDKMLAGDPDARMILFDMPEGTVVWNALPADFDGLPPPDGTPNYMAFFKDDEWGFDHDQMRIWEFTADWDSPGNSTFQEAVILETEPFQARLCDAPRWQCIPQPNSNINLEAISDRLMFRLQYRNFGSYAAMVTNHTVNADGSGRAGVRWYEFRDDLDGNGWYIHQQGTYAPGELNRWMGSIAMNGKGTIALGYTVTGDTVYPSIRYAGQSRGAPLGEMDLAEIEIVEGSGSQATYHRWGDYSMMSVDPADDSTFWFTHEYSIGGWKTRICSFNFGPVQAPFAEAGNDTTICINEVFYRTPVAGHYKKVLWESSGDGIIQNPDRLKLAYLRGDQDIENGSVALSFSAFGYVDGAVATDSFTLHIDSLPIASAGKDTTVCVYNDIPLAGSAGNFSDVMWKTSGDGSFSDPTILDPLYYPGTMDTMGGYVELTLHAVSTACEDTALSTVGITFDPCFGIDGPEGEAFNVEIYPNPNQGRFEVHVTGERSGHLDLDVVNAAGQVLFNQRLNDFNGSLHRGFDLSMLAKGRYLIRIRSDKYHQSYPLLIR